MHRHHTLAFLLLLAAPACDDEPAGDTGNAETGGSETDGEASGTGASAPLEIAGTYADDYGGHHGITMDTWVYDTGEFGVVTTNLMAHDNEEDWVAGEDADNPGTFVRFDWTYDAEDTLWYCNSVFDATSLQDAIDAPHSDASDPSTGGCGGMFPWTKLTPA